MTNQQILEKAIQKAIDGGWQPVNMLKPDAKKIAHGIMHNLKTFDFIYSHPFAKALWPGNMPTTTRLPDWAEPSLAWKHHLQSMVIAEDPIKYLGENI